MIYLILVIIFLGIIAFLKTNKFKGVYGEWQVNRVLKSLAKKVGGLELHDLMLEDHRSSSQIDNLFLSTKALYVIEVKNFNGFVFGSESQQDWTITVKHINEKRGKNGKIYKKTYISKHQFYNPISQNKTHINKIYNLTDIANLIPIYNIVVFGNRAKLKKISHSDSVYVVTLKRLKKTIINIENNLTKELTIEQQSDIIDQLYYHNITSRKRKRKHVKDIKKKYSK